ncbi:MAG TPA: ATP-binding protein [Streptosporangiaceae bacterium]|nr:ATP-binding protein [Streptosporangiaceae bacterium]
MDATQSEGRPRRGGPVRDGLVRGGLAGWWRRRSLRARVTLASTAGLAVALAAAAVLLAGALRLSLIRGLDNSARQGARQVAALDDAHRLPHPVLPGTDTIQVLSPQGGIVDVSPDADRLVPLLSPAVAAANARDGRAVLVNGPAYGLPGEVRVAVAPIRGGGTVIAAVPYSPVAESLATLGRALVIGTPVLLVLLAGAVWLIVGSTLRPIAELRRGAQDVTRTGQPRDLPVPAAHDEVRSLAVTLNDMLSRLGAAQHRQRGLISDTAHELRSPIASIRAQLEVALDHPDGQDWPQTAGDVLADTMRLSALAEDLLVLARLDEAGQPRAAQRVELTALAAGVVSRYPDAPVPVVLAQAEPCQLAGDPDGLRRMLGNLIDNAARYARTQVAVSVTMDGAAARLCVADDGPGIPPRDRERAFGRFTRLEAARSRDGEDAGGAGLGLAIVRATARAHGGSAWLEDAAPGLRAVVLLPGAASSVAATAR